MRRIPVYEVIESRPADVDPEQRPRSACRPLSGDECTVAVTDVRRTDADDGCAHSQLFGGPAAAAAGGIVGALVLGETDCAVDRALEAVLLGMTAGEARDFCVGDGRGGRVSGRLRLVAVRRRVAAGGGWRGDDRLKLAEAARHKHAGNRLYAQGRYVDAFHRFNRAIRAALFVRDPDAAGGADRDALYAATCNNMSACQLHFGNYEHARRLSDKALAVQPDNLKALVRRCRASVELGMFDEALADADRALTRDPGNAVAEHYRRTAMRGVRRQNAVYRDIVKKMFGAGQ